MTTNDDATRIVSTKGIVMSYKLTILDSDVTLDFADMKAFRAWASSDQGINGHRVDGVNVYDEDDEIVAKLRYIKKANRAPRMVQSSDDATTLQDVLDDIDALELDEAADAGVVDAPTHEPVTFPVNTDEEIEDLVDWQMARGRSTGDLPTTITVRPPAEGRPAAHRSTHARMSHKHCGHPLTKEARAICRAAHRATVPAAS